MYHIIEQPVQATTLQIEVHIVLLQKDTTAHNSPAMTMTMTVTMNLTMTTNFILITILQCRKNVQYIQKIEKIYMYYLHEDGIKKCILNQES